MNAPLAESREAPATAAVVAPAPRTHNLGRWSRRIARALTEVVVPTGPGAPTVPTDQIVDFIDDWVRFMPRLFKLLFPVGLLLLELGAFVMGPSLVPFTLMSPARRARYIDGWVKARWRLQRDLIKAVKGLVLMAWYSDPRVGAYLGYTVEEHAQLVSARRLKRHGHDL
jgi:hypothetical protein